MSECSGTNILGKKPVDDFIFLHVHKCGGTTLGYIMRDIYGEDFFWDKSEDSVFVHGSMKIYDIKRVAKSKCIFGHIHADKYVVLNRPYITWLRHPVPRMESEYSIIRQKRITGRSSPLHKHVILDNWGFEEYCQAHHNIFSSNYFGDLRVRDFAFIGITEYFEESLFVLSHIIGKEIPPYYRRNTRRLRRQWFKEGTPQEKNMCRLLNQQDIYFYNRAVRRFLSEFKRCLSLYEPGFCSPIK